MSRYDELRRRYGDWRRDSEAQWQFYRTLAPAMATAFEAFLGCPHSFTRAQGGEMESVRYVSPASAEWDEMAGIFHMHAYDGPPPAGKFHTDGRFYFAIRLFLEQHPQQGEERDAFWFLLSARREEGDQVELVLQQSNERFSINGVSGEGSEPLFRHMMLTLTDFLKAADIHPRKSAFRIGFTAM